MMPRLARPDILTHAELRSQSQEPHPIAMPATTHWTVDMVRALAHDGKRYEVIDGELFVTPAPTWTHQHAVLKLAILLAAYLEQHSIGDVLVAPAEVLVTGDVKVEPDVFVVPLVEGRKPTSWEEAARLLLVIEVLSPTTARADRHVKRRLYQRERVPEYWIVDVDARLIERWRPADERPEIVAERLEWQPDSAIPALVIDLPGYFREVIGT
jgi:Uma2 family endonuclease